MARNPASKEAGYSGGRLSGEFRRENGRSSFLQQGRGRKSV